MPLNFVYDSTALDFPKTNAVPVGPDPTKEVDADHWNRVCQADYDLRDAIVMGHYFGFTSQAADPTPTNANKYWWLRNDDALVLQTPGHVYQVALGEVTAKGDLLAYNGTTFGVLPTGGAGSNGKLLQADSTAPTGLSWLTPNYVTLTGAQDITGAKTFVNGTTFKSYALLTSAAATGGVPLVDSPALRMRGAGWDGGASQFYEASFNVVMLNPVAPLYGYVSMNIGGSEAFAFSAGGILASSAHEIMLLGSPANPAANPAITFGEGNGAFLAGQTVFQFQVAGSPFFNLKLGAAGKARLDNLELGGDVSGTVSNAITVAKLQGRAVSNSAPSDGDLLTWNNGGSTWEPASTIAGAKIWSGSATFNSDLKPTKAIYHPAMTLVTSVASPYTVLATDYFLILDTSGGPITINLPNSPNRLLKVGAASGWGGNQATFLPPGGGTINGGASLISKVGLIYELLCASDGVSWGMYPYWDSSFLTAGTGVSISTTQLLTTISNTGVTSVGLSLPGIFTVSNSPVTTTGTLTGSLANQNANLVFAGPTTAPAAAPTFRSLVAADLPNTAVTPGSYTYSSITVDQQGRLTAASSGTTPTLQAAYTAGTGAITLTVGGGALALDYPSITNAQTNGFLLQNSTATTANPQVQYSPTFRMQGHAWDITAGADKNVRFDTQVITNAGNSTTVRGALMTKYSVDTGAASWTSILAIQSNGQMLVPYVGGGISVPELAIGSGGGTVPYVCANGFYATAGSGNIGVAVNSATYGFMFSTPGATSAGFGPTASGSTKCYYGYDNANGTAFLNTPNLINLDVRGQLGSNGSGTDLILGALNGSRNAGRIIDIKDGSTVLGSFSRYGGQSWTLRQDPGGNNTAGTEIIDFDFNMAATRTWATGALATQRAVVFRAPTYAFAAASTLSSAATVAITNAPIQGTNATISSSYALWVQAGQSRFDGDLYVGTSLTMGGITVGGTYTLGGTATLGASLAMSGTPTLGSGAARAGTAYLTNLDCSSTAIAADPTLSTHLATKNYTDTNLGFGQLTWGNRNGTAADTTAYYTSPFFDDVAATTTEYKIKMTRAGKLSKLYVTMLSAPATQGIVFTVRVNGADTGITCTVAAAGNSATDLTHTQTFSAGDEVSLKQQGVAGITGAGSGIMASLGYTLT